MALVIEDLAQPCMVTHLNNGYLVMQYFPRFPQQSIGFNTSGLVAVSWSPTVAAFIKGVVKMDRPFLEQSLFIGSI